MPDMIGSAPAEGYVGQDLKRSSRTKPRKELNHSTGRRLSVELLSPDILRQTHASTPVGSSVSLFPAKHGDGEMLRPNNKHSGVKVGKLHLNSPKKQRRSGWGSANVRFVPAKRDESPRLEEVRSESAPETNQPE